MTVLKPPCDYQGGKQGLAKSIVDYMLADSGYQHGQHVYDLCCGSGAITIELLNRGIPAEKIIMCDAGPWGAFWRAIGRGEFSLDKFRWYCDRVPKDKLDIPGFLGVMSRSLCTENEIYEFLLLQAGSKSGKPVYKKDGRWVTPGFRPWQEPMVPDVEELYRRVVLLYAAGRGLVCVHDDIDHMIDIAHIDQNIGFVYLDPPYDGLAEYGCGFDLWSFLGFFIRGFKRPVYISESYALFDEARKIGMSSDGKCEEWVSRI